MTTSTSTPVSVASSAGAAGGSVINVSSLVSELVAATQAPQQAIITSQTAAVTANVSALGTLKSALSTFQSALTPLGTPAAFNAVTATSGDPTLFTASAGAGAASGSYTVAVTALASAQQLLSMPVAGGSTAPVGTGTLTLSVGSSSFSVTVDGTDDTLSGIASAINAATGNTGISATVITGSDGAHLLLASTQTGAANTIQVTETDGGTGLAALTYGAGNTGTYSVEAPALDAAFSIAGVPFTSASNSVSNAISGVTLNLQATAGSGSGSGGSATLTVGSDTATVVQNIQAFVAAYNTLQGSLSSLGTFDASTNTAGPLLGNPVLTGTQRQIQNALYSLVGSSNYNTLASIGITTNRDGTLSLNNSTLQTALSTNFTAVSQLFSGTGGIASQLNTQITNDLGTGGSIFTYGQTLVGQENALSAQTKKLDTQMAALTASLTQQYATLNSLLSRLQSTSSYLSQAFASLPMVQGTPNG